MRMVPFRVSLFSTRTLQKYFEKLRPDSTFKRVYVPLCGKSLDLHWLYQQGLEVVGGDISPEAGTMFCDEFPDLQMEKKTVSLANGENVSLYEVCFL